jgi:hypothetical protein
MTIREEVRKTLDKWDWTGNLNLDEGVDALMSLAPLRLAELAEQHHGHRLVVVDMEAYLLFDNDRTLRSDYRKVVAQ